MERSTRHTSAGLGLALAGLFLGTGFVEAAPLRNPANGHYYEVIKTRAPWHQAKATAESMTYGGQSGYLVTITSQQENDFVDALPGIEYYTWSGASDEPAEGEWRWRTGPEAGRLFWTGGLDGTAHDYENWGRLAPGSSTYVEPNGGAGENCMDLRPGAGYGFGWNDDSCGAARAFVVEYGRCGDGVLDPLESCDDGVDNGTDASCCTAACAPVADGESCSDGEPCSSGDVCTAGACTSTGLTLLDPFGDPDDLFDCLSELLPSGVAP